MCSILHSELNRDFSIERSLCFLTEIQLTLQGLRLHLDYSGTGGRRKASSSGDLAYANSDAWASAYSAVAAGAALVAGLGVLAYLRRAGT